MGIEQRRPELHMVMLRTLERIGLVGIALATVIAASQEVAHMFSVGKVALADLLLMFIYLEVLAMVGHYFGSGQLPVRFPLYIGMIALARYLILDMKGMDEWRILAVSGAILLLAITVLIVRYGHVNFPYSQTTWFEPKRRKTDAENTDDQT